MNLKHTAEKHNDKNYSPKNLYFFTQYNPKICCDVLNQIRTYYRYQQLILYIYSGLRYLNTTIYIK